MTTEKICPECNGDGVILEEVEEEVDGEYHSYTDEVQCPECEGEGVLTEDSGDASA